MDGSMPNYRNVKVPQPVDYREKGSDMDESFRGTRRAFPRLGRREQKKIRSPAENARKIQSQKVPRGPARRESPSPQIDRWLRNGGRGG